MESTLEKKIIKRLKPTKKPKEKRNEQKPLIPADNEVIIDRMLLRA